jgi:hypothetical protein
MSLTLDFIQEPVFKYICRIQNASKKRVKSLLEKNTWIFHYDYIMQKYYLTIKKDRFINRSVIYLKENDRVISKHKLYSNLDEFILEMSQKYNFNLSDQIFY